MVELVLLTFPLQKYAGCTVKYKCLPTSPAPITLRHFRAENRYKRRWSINCIPMQIIVDFSGLINIHSHFHYYYFDQKSLTLTLIINSSLEGHLFSTFLLLGKSDLIVKGPCKHDSIGLYIS